MVSRHLLILETRKFHIRKEKKVRQIVAFFALKSEFMLVLTFDRFLSHLGIINQWNCSVEKKSSFQLYKRINQKRQKTSLSLTYGFPGFKSPQNRIFAAPVFSSPKIYNKLLFWNLSACYITGPTWMTRSGWLTR